ncbi:MAG: outer membrane lipoprotein-sorting protein [Desulfofustis sp.]|nr:outer membrane lipoprotein-sorting protein [Desulfofustis sp.]NNK56282.1 outer membrane lipoprotein-sorting protein [Desulfofustis sp.]RZW22016.1 MAG: outer membrane lipoprotein-sorting protein [Desulfobulbaceae bacterium]
MISYSLLIAIPAQAALDARAIMERVDARDDGDNQTANLEMILIDQKDNERKRTIKLFSKDKGKDTLRLQFFLSPADVKDTGFLTYDFYGGERDDDQWLYLPDLRKTKRIATSDKSSSFMGSDFSYADMTRRVLDEWTYKLLKEDEVDGQKVWLIEALPISKTVEDRYGYQKSIVYVRQDNYMVVRAIHVLKSGNKVKYMEVKKLDKVDGIWVALETWMKTTRNKRTLHRTILTMDNIKYNQDLDESFFSVRQLEKGL